jgi:hypothetical protein
MDFATFEASLAEASPPEDLSDLLRALWHECHGDWDRAHTIVQDIHDADGAWIHAHVHRREGDQSNAAYWYRMAGRPVSQGDMDEAWRDIVSELLASRVKD